MARGEMKLKVALLSMAILLFAGAAKGQILYGSLTGNITDATNAPIAGAKVEALNVETGIIKSDVSDVRGIYVINELQPGTYRVTISNQGFATVSRDSIAAFVLGGK